MISENLSHSLRMNVSDVMFMRPKHLSDHKCVSMLKSQAVGASVASSQTNQTFNFIEF